MELREQDAFNALAGFVSGPELIAKRLDDVICRDAKVSGPFFQHPNYSSEHTSDSPEWRISFFETTEAVEVSEKLVCTVNQVNDHCLIRRLEEQSKVQSPMSG
jgi:hypothetical protein